jgi:hypothetical protein
MMSHSIIVGGGPRISLWDSSSFRLGSSEFIRKDVSASNPFN